MAKDKTPQCSFCGKKKDEVANTLLNLETIWDEYGVYEKVEDKTDEERNV